MLQILRVLLCHGLAHVLGSRIARRRPFARWLPMAREPGPVRLRLLFEELGGSFVKFGQMLALQPDLVAVECCNALFDLLDRVEPFPYSEVERIVREELGRPPQEVFDLFDPAPLATASVGQVHIAYWRGRKVAVKVQRPDAERQFRSDIRLMLATLAWIRRLRLKRLYWLIEPMTEFAGWTQEELDYRCEAAYSERLRKLLRSNASQYVPEVVGELSSRRVLVVEFLEGATLLDYMRSLIGHNDVVRRRLEADGFDRDRFAANVVDNFLGNAFRLGIYHADLHPANLMILPGSRVGYIDFGITGVMSPYARHHLMAMTLALARGDVEQLCERFLKVTVHGPDSDLAAFRSGLERLAAGWYADDGRSRAGGRRLAARFTRIMGEMLQLSRDTDVMPERDVVKYIRSSIAVDGLIGRFAPDFDLGGHLARACASHVRSGLQRGFSAEQLARWSRAAGQLLGSGPSRSLRLLERLASGELPARLQLDDGEADESAALRSRSLQLAGMIFALALLTTLGGDTLRTAPTLLAAELLFAVATLGMLLQTLRRLAR